MRIVCYNIFMPKYKKATARSYSSEGPIRTSKRATIKNKRNKYIVLTGTRTTDLANKTSVGTMTKRVTNKKTGATKTKTLSKRRWANFI